MNLGITQSHDDALGIVNGTVVASDGSTHARVPCLVTPKNAVLNVIQREPVPANDVRVVAKEGPQLAGHLCTEHHHHDIRNLNADDLQAMREAMREEMGMHGKDTNRNVRRASNHDRVHDLVTAPEQAFSRGM